MIMDKFSLKGKVAVVTGANTGLGQGMCVALAQAGCKGSRCCQKKLRKKSKWRFV